MEDNERERLIPGFGFRKFTRANNGVRAPCEGDAEGVLDDDRHLVDVDDVAT